MPPLSRGPESATLHPMRRLGLLLAVWVSGCAAGAVGNAVINTAIAVGASAVSRSQGDCYASCTNGTTCNHATGCQRSRHLAQRLQTGLVR